jgi:UDP-sugar transporter A1/2/3
VLVPGQWLAILVLSVGVAAVQTSFVPSASLSLGALSESFNMEIGIPAVLLSCITSGMAGVYNERNVKNTHLSLIVRNTQMTAVSLAIALLGCLSRLVDSIL